MFQSSIFTNLSSQYLDDFISIIFRGCWPVDLIKWRIKSLVSFLPSCSHESKGIINIVEVSWVHSRWTLSFIWTFFIYSVWKSLNLVVCYFNNFLVVCVIPLKCILFEYIRIRVCASAGRTSHCVFIFVWLMVLAHSQVSLTHLNVTGRRMLLLLIFEVVYKIAKALNAQSVCCNVLFHFSSIIEN